MERDEYFKMMVGGGGDYYIGTVAVTTQNFRMIVVGPDGATLTDVKIGGVSVFATKGYPVGGVLPAGYMLVAGGDSYFDYIEFSAGNAAGYIK